MNPADRLRAYPGLATMEPRLGAFPAPQRQLWPALAEVPLDTCASLLPDGLPARTLPQ